VPHPEPLYRAPMRPSRLARTAVATTFLLVVSGCSGEEPAARDADDTGDKGGTSASEAVAATESPSPSASPGDDERPPKPPKAADTKKARTAFVKFVVESWGFALRHNDPAPVVRLSPSRKQACLGCADLEAELAERRKQGWYVDFPGADIGRIELGPGPEPGTFAAAASIDIPATLSFFDDGSVRNTSEEHANSSFELLARRDGKEFTLLGFRIG
jgi:hypothetical protein